MENERRYSGEALHGTMPEANLEMGSGFDERRGDLGIAGRL